MYTGFCGRDLRERVQSEDLGLDDRIVLKWIFKKWNGEAQTVLIWLRTGTGGGACECRNEPSGSVKCEEFLDSLRTYWILKEFLKD